MKRKFIPVALFLGMSLLDCSAEMDREEAIREIDAKIAALQKEKAKLLAESGESPSALHDENGKVSHRITNSVVIIEGDKSVGTGFVAMTEGKKYLYTAAHVFGGNSKLTIRSATGTEFKKFGDLQAAEGADLIRLEMLDDPAHYLELAPVDSLVPLNTEIAALGNGGGNGVVAVETGKVLGTSADLLEVDAAIIQGNSGGPVVELATGKVVGEVTHLTSARKDIWSEGTRQGEVRRFACRLNKEWKWTTYKTGTFLNDSRALEEFDELTRLCFAIAQLEPGESGLRLNARLSEDTTVLSVFDKNKENDLVRSLIGMNTELSSRKMSLSDAELNKKFRSLLAQAEARASRSNQAFKPQGFAWFLRNRATFSVDARNESILALKRRLERLR